MNVSIEKALQQLDGLILGKQAVLRQLLACILAGGHVLLEDVPGVGKTTLARILAQSFNRRQPGVNAVLDLVSSDSATANLQALVHNGGLAFAAGRPDLDSVEPFTIDPSIHELALGAA